ncbi:leucine--tRNA ligase, partial [Patescibacteria group bacterium]|nr:leucine--tRNA ligase [Patescibacteria group bacterium]
CRSYSALDAIARKKRMEGYNVLFPIGWDAFGLPTENYAIKTKQAPQKVTDENTAMFKRQMKRLAYSFDWEREINTTDPEYYKWTQWIFIQLFKKGLAYKKEMPINWCPSCKTGLANEEVVDSKCERCGAEVSRRNMSQWIVKITDYADKLISGLEKTDFIEKVKKAQINWIGKSEGINIDYPIVGGERKLSCYSTRPETNFGATFIVIAPEHEQVAKLTTAENKEAVEKYRQEARKKSEMERTELAKEKTGVFTGTYALNRLTNRKMPIYVSDFVVLGAGTGVVVGVPACDVRDWDFAKKYNLPMIKVVDDEGRMINSDFLDGMKTKEAKEKIMDYLEEKGWGRRASNYHLRDWIFSRQHYWGEPIPMINCPKCKWVSVPEKDLPVRLPEVEAYQPTSTGESPLADIKEFVNCKCPVCGGEARRETDTMPNWAGSDWYFLAYCFAKKLKNNNEILKRVQDDTHDVFIDIFSDSQEELKKWLPVDVYIGGDEHNTLHLLYSRFIVNFLYDIGVSPVAEPYDKRLSHGVILGPDNQRMSKSKENVIMPEVVADKYGVDVLRLYLMFMGPFEGTMAWNEKTLMGVKRFLDKFEKFIEKQVKNMAEASGEEVKKILNKTILGVSKDLEAFSFNTAVAKQMEMVNKLQVASQKSQVKKEDIEKMIKMLAPLAPYVAEEMWQLLGEKDSVHVSRWPEVEEKYLKEDKITIPVAINGKVRGEFQVESQKLQDEKGILEVAKKLEAVQKWTEGKKIVKEIYVPGKMINLVIN